MSPGNRNPINPAEIPLSPEPRSPVDPPTLFPGIPRSPSPLGQPLREVDEVNQANRRAAQRLRADLRLAALNQAPPSRASTALPDVSALQIKSKHRDMAKPVLFYGKHSQLDDVITYVDIQFRIDGTISEGVKAATLASLFRGPALTWLASLLKRTPTVLDDYAGFLEQVNEEFQLNEHAEKAQAARAITSVHQTKDVQTYATRFRQLAEKAGVSGATATALFVKGLKPNVRNGIILNNEQGNLADAIDEATRIDSQMYYSSGGSHRSSNPRRGRDKKGRYTGPRTKSEFHDT